jgi:dihydroorotate dehydrogenase electron transfer subunit
MPYLAEEAVVLSNRAEGDARRLRLRAERFAAAARPFQFALVGLPGDRFLLRRPLSVLDAAAGDVDVLVRAVGAGTRELAAWGGNVRCALSGPFGRAFEPPADALFIAGGIGYAGVYFAVAAAARRGERPRLLLGVRRGHDVYDVGALTALGAEVTVIAEDGVDGLPGVVTDHLPAPPPAAVVACGPRAMYGALRERLGPEVPLFVLMEERMACGVGACRSCVVPVTDSPTGYACVCSEGPAFDAAVIRWEALRSKP